MREWESYRCSTLGNMLRGEVHFTAEYSSAYTVTALVAYAFNLLFGVAIQCEQELEYLPLGESETVKARVRACLSWPDAEHKPDFLARLAALNATNPTVFQTSDLEWLNRDTFTDVPAGSVNLQDYPVCPC